MTAAQVELLAQILLSYCLRVSAGDVLLISGSTASEPLMTALFQQAIDRLALPVIRLEPDLCYETALRFSGAPDGRYLNPLGLPEGELIDCSIGIKSREAADDPAAAGGSQLPLSGSDGGQHPEAFLNRVGDGTLRWVGTVFPTTFAARSAGMTLAEFEELVVSAALLDRPDPVAAWRLVHDRQQALCDELERAHEIRVCNPQGTDLTFGIQGRRWVNGDGRFNLPDGEVFTAPIEDSVNGVFYSSWPRKYRGDELDGVRLEFKDGRVVDAAARCGEQSLLRLLDQDEGSRRVGELGIGTNDRLRRATGVNLLDEKIGGTFHLALGYAYPHTGGRNKSAIHVDIVSDLRGGGVIEVDGRVVSLHGRFIDRDHA